MTGQGKGGWSAFMDAYAFQVRLALARFDAAERAASKARRKPSTKWVRRGKGAGL